MTEEIKEQQLKKFEILHKKYKSHLESMAVSVVYPYVPNVRTYVPNCWFTASVYVCTYVYT